MKTMQDNKVTDHVGTLYTENDTELSWPIGLDANCDKNQIGHLRDLTYKCGLCWKWNWGTW